MPEALPGLPGVTFDFAETGHVIRAYCESCGHTFTPQTPMAPEPVWNAIRRSDHDKFGCNSSKAGSFTVLKPE